MKIILCLGVAASALLGATATQAQDAAGSQLDTIVVTAERRSTNLQKTPLSVVAYNQEALEQRGVTTTEDLARFTPGLSAGGDVEGGSSRPVFAIRGVGQSSGRDTIERGVGLYVDDIYIPRTTGTFLQLLDVDHIEVLRGPQGTLFGRNSTGGAIRYVTRPPDHDLSGALGATVASFNRVDVTGLVNIPFGDKAAGRFQVGSFRSDGFVTIPNSSRTLGDVDDAIVRGALRFWPTEQLTIDVGASYQISKSTGPAQTILGLSTTSPQTQALSRLLTTQGQPPLQVNDRRFVLTDRYANAGNCFTGNNGFGLANANGTNIFNDKSGYCDYGVDQNNHIAFANIKYDVSDALSLRAITGAVQGESNATMDWSGLGVGVVRDTSKFHSLSQELQLSYTGGKWNTVGGLYYFSEHPVARSETRNIVFQGPASPNTGLCCTGLSRLRDLTTTSYAAFGQVTYAATDALSITLGGRYSTDEKKITVSRKDRPTAQPGRAFTAKDSWAAFNYRASIQYQFTDDIMAYATATSGFKSGGFNDDIQPALATNGGVTGYAPEKVKSIEGGVRTQFLDGRLRANLTAFSMDYSDLQLATPVFDTSGGSISILLLLANAGRVKLSGMEGEFAFRVTDALSLNAAVSVLDQKYKSLAAGSALLIASTCANPAAPTLATCQAQDLGRAPKLQYTLGAEYRLDLASRGALKFTAAYAWTDKQQSSNSTANSILLPSYGVLNLRAQYEPDGAAWSAAVFGSNVTDEYYLSTGADFRGFYGSVAGALGRPAEYGAELKYKF